MLSYVHIMFLLQSTLWNSPTHYLFTKEFMSLSDVMTRAVLPSVSVVWC